MDRKKFIKSAVLTGLAGVFAPQLLKAKNTSAPESTCDIMMQQVGFNHLPIKIFIQ